MVRFRPYQRECLAAVDLALAEHGAGLVVAATGTGKTTIFSKLAERAVGAGERALVLAHRTELIDQARNRLLSDTSLGHFAVGVEQGPNHSSPAHRVVVASVQTMQGKRLKGFDPAAFDLIICDEAHHAPARSYRDIFTHFAGAKRVGFTATPDRLDGQGLAKWFHGVCFAYEIRDAIADGYLVPIRAKMVYVDDIDLSSVRRTAGDLDEGDLDRVLTQASTLQGIVKPSLELVEGRPTLVFANSVAHAKALAETYNAHRPDCAVALDGSMAGDLRRPVLDAFRRGRFQFLVNCALFTEGVDLPHVAAVVMGRPTSSRALYAQMAGRVTRCLGADIKESIANGKPDGLILDMVGNAGRHKLVCALDVIDGAVDEKVRARATRKIMEAEDGFDVLDALARSEEEEVEQQRLDLKAKVQYRVVEVKDQFTILGINPRPGRWGGMAMSEKQLEVLNRAKIKNAEKLDRGQASAVIDKLMDRRERGLCTLPQATLLAKYGLDPDLSFEEAGKVISRIVENGWEVPADLIEERPELLAQATA